MTKQEKLDRLSKAGYTVAEHFHMTIRYTSGKYGAKNIYNLHKQIFGY